MTAQQQSKKPNIVVITARGCGRAFGCYGAKTVSAPNIDKLAAEGALFDNFFGVSSDSSPNQGALFTGLHPQRNGLLGQCEEPWNWEMNDDVVHLAQLLKLDGYATLLFRLQDETAIGNWKRLGFEEYRARDVNPALENADPAKAWSAGKVAREFASFLNERAKRPGPKRPFYAQIGFYEARPPFDYGGARRDSVNGVEIPSRMKDGHEAQALVSAFQGALKEIDKAVETIMGGLKRCELDDSTIVIFTSSCGPDLVRDNGTLYDAGIALPLAIRQPGTIPAGTRISDICCPMDILPTLLESIESDIPFNLDGRSLVSSLRGGKGQGASGCVYGIHTDSRYVRTADFKLIVNLTQASQYVAPPVDIANLPAKEPVPPFELYNLKDDPGETRNLAISPANAKTLNDLRLKLAAWMEKAGDPILRKVYPTDYFRKAIATLMAK